MGLFDDEWAEEAAARQRRRVEMNDQRISERLQELLVLRTNLLEEIFEQADKATDLVELQRVIAAAKLAYDESNVLGG